MSRISLPSVVVVAAAALAAAALSGCRNDIVHDYLDAGPLEGEGEGDAVGEGEGDSGCADAPVPAIRVSLTDSATNFPVCDASVHVVDGDFDADLVAVGSGAACAYEGPADRAGNYTLTISKVGYTTLTLPAVVDVDDCGPVTRVFALFLDPT